MVSANAHRPYSACRFGICVSFSEAVNICWVLLANMCTMYIHSIEKTSVALYHLNTFKRTYGMRGRVTQ